MSGNRSRRAILEGAAFLPFAAAFGRAAGAGEEAPPARTGRIKLSCNLYSFDAPRHSGETTLDSALVFETLWFRQAGLVLGNAV